MNRNSGFIRNVWAPDWAKFFHTLRTSLRVLGENVFLRWLSPWSQHWLWNLAVSFHNSCDLDKSYRCFDVSCVTKSRFNKGNGQVHSPGLSKAWRHDMSDRVGHGTLFIILEHGREPVSFLEGWLTFRGMASSEKVQFQSSSITLNCCSGFKHA